MANGKRTSQLGIAPTLAANDRVVVLTNPANTVIANTQTITVPNFLNALANNLPGPFANDLAASGSGVSLLNFYYDINGFVRIRIT